MISRHSGVTSRLQLLARRAQLAAPTHYNERQSRLHYAKPHHPLALGLRPQGFKYFPFDGVEQ